MTARLLRQFPTFLFLKIPVISHDRRKDDEIVTMTKETYRW